jgi:hypothetical protein
MKLLWKPNEKNWSSEPKRKQGLPFKEIATRNISAGAGSSGAPVRGPAATNEAAVKISAKGREEPVAGNQSEVKPGTPLLGVSGSNVPLQGASTSSTHTAGDDLVNIVSGVGGLRLARKTVWLR